MLYGNVIIFSFASRVTNLLLIPPPPNINWIIPKLNPKLIPSPCCPPYIELNSMRHGSECWWREFCSIDFTKHRIRECRDQPQEHQLLWVITQVIKCMKAKYPTHPRCGLQTALSYIWDFIMHLSWSFWVCALKHLHWKCQLYSHILLKGLYTCGKFLTFL